MRDGSDATDDGRAAAADLVRAWPADELYPLPEHCERGAMGFREVVAQDEETLKNWCGGKGSESIGACLADDDGTPYVIRWHLADVRTAVTHELVHWLQGCASGQMPPPQFGLDHWHRDQRVWFWHADRLGVAPICNEEGVVREYLESLPRRCSDL